MRMTRFSTTFIGVFVVLLAGCGSTFGGGPLQNAPNKYLWNAALETLSFLPVTESDPFEGLIATGWNVAPGSQVSFRATVLVEGRELDARNLKVAVFRRSAGSARPASAETVKEVEAAILARARQLRIADIRQTDG